jgi:hypothetical protein
MTWRKMALLVIPAVALALAGAGPALAGPVLTVSNGNFALYSGPGTPGSGANGSDYFTNVNPVGWSATGTPASNSNLIFVTNQSGVNDNSLYLQVYNTQPVSGPAAPFPAPPPGGNFVEADGNPTFEESFSYQLSGLTPGQTYSLSFFQAASQQQGFQGDTTNQWIVGLGTPGGFNISYSGSQASYSLVDPSGSVAVSPLMSVPTGTYVPWQQVTLQLTADAPNDLLTFLAWGNGGNTANLPPIAFLDIAGNGAPVGAPEPSSLLLMGGCLGGLGVAYLRQRRAKRAPAV